MEEIKKEKPFDIGGLNPILFTGIMVMLVVLSSAIGYVFGIANIDDLESCKVEVEVKTDSALMEVIRGQVKVEIEMLRVINENANQTAPIVNNIIKTRPSNYKPCIVNSFNHKIVKSDSLSK